MAKTPIPKGDVAREAIDALRGYVYQIYQSALAWLELEFEEFLFLEVAEDFAVVASDALEAVQIKETAHNVTINSDDIVASIDSFVKLRIDNPELKVRLRHLTTSKIGKEKSAKYRIGDTPTLKSWRKLSKTGNLGPLRKILDVSKLSEQTKNYIRALDDAEFREDFLKKIHFDCGALDSKFVSRTLRSKLSKLLMARGGVNSQVDGCLNGIFIALLRKATQKTDRFVDCNMLEELIEKATQIPINRGEFEKQSQLISKALSASVSPVPNFVTARLSAPCPIDEVPLPTAVARRTIQTDKIVSSLSKYGISWIFGTAGVGKTIGAKIVARRLGGNWATINLRGLNAEQVNLILSEAIDTLTERKIDGLLVDDIENSLEPNIFDTLLHLNVICDRADILLLFISSRSPSPDFLFSANLPESIQQKFKEFSIKDVQEILDHLGVQNINWAKYIHAVSGGGHPQLVIAAIQSMQKRGWDINEFKSLNSLIKGDTAVEEVRARTRERLLNELPEGGRRLLERLSLMTCSFRRSLVLDLAQVPTAVPDGGIIFDQLIGSWVDHQERDRYNLSPLMSNFANNTLNDEQKRKINFEIANSIMKGRSLDPIEANAALLAALLGKNTQVIVYLCMAVIRADQNEIEMLAPHLMIFTYMKTDVFAYQDDPDVSQILRGLHLILASQEKTTKEDVTEILNRFEIESECVENELSRTYMTFFIYLQLLLSEPKFGAFPNFWDLVYKLDGLLEKQDTLFPKELLREVATRENDGIPFSGFMFLNQARQIKLINDLIPPFKFLDTCGIELRQKLLKPYKHPDYHVDMIVSGAWLSEHDENTIDPPVHSKVFAKLEEFAKSWGHLDLAVCCRKYQAIIIDEYGSDKVQALAVLNEGLALYGATNSELVRAKAKVLHRAEDHEGSLLLSKSLIEGDASLNETEKAFLGRDAAISAEKNYDYETARRYYLYGSNAAGDCSHNSMEPMRVGLMADAALASWHAGDRETCLRDFVLVLQELNDIDPKSSLKAAHCHSVCRHVLLWLDQDSTGEKRVLSDGENTKIYPGVVSNPEPHSEIGERYITPIEMAWYMLAVVENNSCLNLGLSENLETFLPNGPVFEGQFYLTASKMRKALMLLDSALFVTALKEIISEVAYVKKRGGLENSFNIKDVTYCLIPVPTLEQQASLSDLAEQHVLCFISECIFEESVAKIDSLLELIEVGQEFITRKEFMNCLRGYGAASDYNASMAAFLDTHRRAIEKQEMEALLPMQIFELALKAIQIAIQTNNIRVMGKSVFEWLNKKWALIIERQSFLLRSPNFHDKFINQARIAEGDSWVDNTINLLKTILPTIGIQNEHQVNNMLNDIQRQKKGRRVV